MEEDGLARLHRVGAAQEILHRHALEHHRRGGLVVDAVRDLDDVRGGHQADFGVSAHGRGGVGDAVADRQILHPVADRLHRARALEARRERAFGDGIQPRAVVGVDVVQADETVADADLAGAGVADLDLLPAHDFGAARLMGADGVTFHGFGSLLRLGRGFAGRRAGFEREQKAFRARRAAPAAELAAGGRDAVARDDDGDRVRAARPADRAGGASDRGGERAIGPRLAEGDRRHRRPYAALERRARRRQRQREARQAPGEIGFELRRRLGERAAGRGARLCLRAPLDAGEGAAGGGQAQPADRGFENRGRHAGLRRSSRSSESASVAGGEQTWPRHT